MDRRNFIKTTGVITTLSVLSPTISTARNTNLPPDGFIPSATLRSIRDKIKKEVKMHWLAGQWIN